MGTGVDDRENAALLATLALYRRRGGASVVRP